MVSNDYLNRIGFATIRREPNDDDQVMTDLLIDYIEQGRAQLASYGVNPMIAEDEDDPRVRGCIQSYVRWRFAQDNRDSANNLEEFRLQADELRKAVAHEAIY